MMYMVYTLLQINWIKISLKLNFVERFKAEIRELINTSKKKNSIWLWTVLFENLLIIKNICNKFH